MAELKPCPFCGGTDIEVFDCGGWETHCASCYASGQSSGHDGAPFTKEQAIAAWNRRATDGQRDTARGVPEITEEWCRNLAAKGYGSGYRMEKTILKHCRRMIEEVLAAAPTPPDGDAGRPEPYVEVTVRVGDAIARQVGAKVAFERTYRQWDWLELLARQAINDAMAASKGAKA